jgi:hypothetical protein
MRIIQGIIGIIIGFLVIKYSISLTDTLGRMDWAEKYLSSTVTMYRVVGVVFIILSFMYMFGLMGVIAGPLGPLFGK